jgi:hypothetical protein
MRTRFVWAVTLICEARIRNNAAANMASDAATLHDTKPRGLKLAIFNLQFSSCDLAILPTFGRDIEN